MPLCNAQKQNKGRVNTVRIECILHFQNKKKNIVNTFWKTN